MAILWALFIGAIDGISERANRKNSAKLRDLYEEVRWKAYEPEEIARRLRNIEESGVNVLSIAGGRGGVLVAEEGLDSADVRALLEGVGREGLAERWDFGRAAWLCCPLRDGGFTVLRFGSPSGNGCKQSDLFLGALNLLLHLLVAVGAGAY